MNNSVMFLDCPEYMDTSGAARCGLPAAVEYRYTMTSTDGPLESAKICCPRGHVFNGPVDSFIWPKPEAPGSLEVRPADRVERDGAERLRRRRG